MRRTRLEQLIHRCFDPAQQDSDYRQDVVLGEYLRDLLKELEVVSRALQRPPDALLLDLIIEAGHDQPDWARLNFLDEAAKSGSDPGAPWVLRDSATGRGMRLHQTRNGAESRRAHPTVREAIDAAMEAQGASEGSGYV